MESNLDTAFCCFLLTGDDGLIIEANQRLCSKLGYKKEELIGKKVDLIFPIATRIFYQTHLFPLLKMQGTAEEIFITLKKKEEGELPLILNVERKEDQEKTIIQYFGIIVHNRKKFEDELVAAKKTAEAALRENTELTKAKESLQQHLEELDEHLSLINKQNEELQQFNQVVTHNLQEPLRKLSIFSNLLLEGNPAFGDEKSVIAKLLKTADQMRSVITGLQNYIWLTSQDNNPTTIDFNSIILQAQQKLEKDFPGENLELEVENIPPIQADQGQIHLLIYQLLSNAIRFRKQNENAIVRITSTRIQKNLFTNVKGKYKYREYLQLQVIDKGVGFESEYKHQVFDLFKRLHEKSGIGIGLSLCKKIVENHQGRITLDTKPGQGAIVTILLPFDQGIDTITKNQITNSKE